MSVRERVVEAQLWASVSVGQLCKRGCSLGAGEGWGNCSLRRNVLPVLYELMQCSFSSILKVLVFMSGNI